MQRRRTFWSARLIGALVVPVALTPALAQSAPASNSSPALADEPRTVFYISGRVLQEDGTPPPQPATIERICRGVVRPEGHTDSSGGFSFELGRNQNLMADASVRSEEMGSVFDRGSARRTDSLRVAEPEIMDCDVRASLAGYISDVVPLGGRRLKDKPDLGIIVLRRIGKDQGATVSAVSARAPKDARQAYEDAQGKIREGKFAEARKDLQRAVKLYPQYASAWDALGIVSLRLVDTDGARTAYTKAVEADPKFVLPLLQLAVIAGGQGRWQEVLDLTQRAAKLDSVSFPGAYYYSAVAYFKLRNYDAAERDARQTIRIDAQHRFPEASHMLGLILAQKGDFTGASEQLKTYLQLAPATADTYLVHQLLAEFDRISKPAKLIRR